MSIAIDPASLLERVVAAVETILILATICQFILETVPSLDEDYNPRFTNVWFGIESFVSVVFTLETIVRLA